MSLCYPPPVAARYSAPAGELHPTVTLVEAGVQTFGPTVYGCPGLNPTHDLRCGLHRLFEQFVDERSEGRLPDFVTHPHTSAIGLAAFYGFVSGDDGANTFRPDEPINRVEVAKIIALAAE